MASTVSLHGQTFTTLRRVLFPLNALAKHPKTTRKHNLISNFSIRYKVNFALPKFSGYRPGVSPDRYNVFFVAVATSLSHNGILIRDLVQILVGDVGIVWILIEFGFTPGGWVYLHVCCSSYSTRGTLTHVFGIDSLKLLLRY